MSFLSWLFNPFILLIFSVPITAVVFLLAGMYVSQPKKDRVVQLSPESGTGKEYDINIQDSTEMGCKPLLKGEAPQRFLKTGQAYNVIKKTAWKLQSSATWIGRIGTAYTYPLGNESVTISFIDSVKQVFTEETFNRLSGELKKRIAEAQIGVTVKFPQVSLTPLNPNFNPEQPISQLNPKYMPMVNSDDVRRGAFDKFINSLATGIYKLATGGNKVNLIQLITSAGAGGCAVMLILLAFGRIK